MEPLSCPTKVGKEGQSNETVFTYYPVGSCTCHSPLHLPTQAVPQIPLYVDGILLETDVPPLIYNSRVLVPLRSAGEAVNSYVEYYPEDKSIAAWNNGTKIELKVYSKTAYINSKPVQLDTRPSYPMEGL